MKFSKILDAASAGALEVAWLHRQLEPCSEPGRRAYAQIVPFTGGQEDAAQESSQSVAELARQLDREQVAAMRDALGMMPDPIDAISRAGMGDTLEDAHLLELLRFLENASRLQPYVPLGDEGQAALDLLERGRSGKFAFYLSENFDSQLGHARVLAERAQAEFDSARGRLAQRLAHALGKEELPGNEFIVMRDEVRTLPQGVRVVREAPTYYLCELEFDQAALGALRKRDDAADALAAAEQQARISISQSIRRWSNGLQKLTDAVGAFDVTLAFVHFTQQYGCVPAQIGKERALAFTTARYLPLQEQLTAQGRRYEPISIALEDVAVLTGPNMGGKSVALRTCGFIALLAAFGIPVPAQSARVCLFAEIAWLGIGAQEEPGGLLSSFAREVVRLREILDRREAPALLLIDEFARTTTPTEGGALLVALITELRRRASVAFIATHLAGIAQRAGVPHFAVRGLRNVPSVPPGGDLAAALASLADSMDYTVGEVTGSSAAHADALALARLLGLDEAIVAQADAVLRDETEETWTR